MEKKITIQPDGKKVEEVFNDDGTKSVKIHVATLSLDNPDESDLKAKEFIEEKVLKHLGDRLVDVLVIHKGSLLNASGRVPYTLVRKFAETVVRGFPVQDALGVEGKPKLTDFIVVEIEGDQKRVSSLADYESVS